MFAKNQEYLDAKGEDDSKCVEHFNTNGKNDAKYGC